MATTNAAAPRATIMPDAAPATVTDFQRDLDRLDRKIARPSDASISAEAASGEVVGVETTGAGPSRHDAIRLVSLQYQRAMLLGSWDALREVEESLVALIGRLGPLPDLCLLQATLDLTMHRLGGVRAALRRSPALAESWHGRALAADVLVQEGRYAEARQTYEAVMQAARTWENLARLAQVHRELGHREQADRLYSEAEEEITAKEMRAYAWVELMRGELDLACGAHDRARAHYERAGAAYSGYWLVEAHLAELHVALGQADEAIRRYLGVVASVPRPELIQALGDAYVLAGRSDEARACHDRALAGFLAAAQRHEVQYLHHLANFYANVRLDGREAVRWAEADFALRPSPYAEATLAWAEYRAGRLPDALRHIRHALASGASGTQALRHSAVIHRAAGDDATASLYTLLADQAGPVGATGHTHP